MTDSGKQGHAALGYQQQEILNEEPVALIARLYDMAGLEVARARNCMSSGQWNVKGIAVQKASQCISLLQVSLNLDQGGEIAKNLDRIYTYLMRRLSEAHLQNDEKIFEEIATHLSELGGAWHQVAGKSAKRVEAPATDQQREMAATP